MEEKKAAKFIKQTARTIIDWELFVSLVGFWDDTVTDNIDDEYERLVKHLHGYTKILRVLKPPRDACLLKHLG
ncbi:hypothetical protein RB195_015284 [Necator americanus]|uniref:Uncharacterized protein n=1 Tax=Necator americanus TaxID=51031 RepID=A0ABR1E5M8_NECAM